MATTQYVGARYVPLFADPSEWSNANAYEPLTIVVHEGNSYTSKMAVPKGVDISNEKYWALTGNYNAQVEQYRQEVKVFGDGIKENTAAITAEITRAKGVETTLSEDIDIERERAMNAESELDSKITKEVETLNTTIETETSRATSAESELNSKITKEVETLNTTIETETSRATSAEKVLDTAIKDEVKRATEKESVLTVTTNNLQNSIATLSNNIAGNILLLGDSYSQGYTPDGTVTSWINVVKSALNGLNIKVYSNAQGGTSFGGSTTWYNLLNSTISSLGSDVCSTISTIYIGGGYNDWNLDTTSISNGVDSVKRLITANFPNIKRIMFDWFGKGVTGNTTGSHSSYLFATMAPKVSQTCEYCNNNGIASNLNSINVLNGNDCFSSDYVHPSETGQWLIGKHVVNRLLTGSSYIRPYTTNIPNNLMQIGSTDEPFGVYIQPARFGGVTFGFSSRDIVCNGSNGIQVTTFTPTAGFQLGSSVYVTANCVFRYNGSNYMHIPAICAFTNSGTQIAISVYPCAASGSNYITLSSANQVQIQLTGNSIVKTYV